MDRPGWTCDFSRCGEAVNCDHTRPSVTPRSSRVRVGSPPHCIIRGGATATAAIYQSFISLDGAEASRTPQSRTICARALHHKPSQFGPVVSVTCIVLMAAHVSQAHGPPGPPVRASGTYIHLSNHLRVVPLCHSQRRELNGLHVSNGLALQRCWNEEIAIPLPHALVSSLLLYFSFFRDMCLYCTTCGGLAGPHLAQPALTLLPCRGTAARSWVNRVRW